MTVPKYVQDIMSRSEYFFDYPVGDEKYAAGYSIRIRKATPYTTAKSFLIELERFKRWVERQQGGEIIIASAPAETHHRNQYAVVTIWDPVMQHIERFIP